MEMTIEKQKAVADDVLHKLFLIQPYAIVAGGAPRDWLDGKLATDVDVFVDTRHINTAKKERELFAVAGLLRFEKGEGRDWDDIPEHYKKNPNIKRVYNLEIDGVAVQLICVKCPCWDVVEQFPIPICQAWYKNGRIGTTLEYKLCKKVGALVITNHVYGMQDKFIKKISEKFPPPRFNWYSTMEHVKGVFIHRSLRDE